MFPENLQCVHHCGHGQPSGEDMASIFICAFCHGAIQAQITQSRSSSSRFVNGMIFLEFHVTVDPERLRAFRQRHFAGPTTLENLNIFHIFHIIFLSLCTLYPWKASRTDQGHINPHDFHDHASAGLSRLSRKVAAPS